MGVAHGQAGVAFAFHIKNSGVRVAMFMFSQRIMQRDSRISKRPVKDQAQVLFYTFPLVVPRLETTNPLHVHLWFESKSNF